MNDNKKLIIESAKKVLSIESEEINKSIKRIDENFAKVAEVLFQCNGRLIFSGMGKSGHIARKIASTFSSTGTPSFFMHPGEASHGDLGMIVKDDVVIFLSNSGESDEIFTLIPNIKRIGAKIISITGNASSELAQHSDYHISSAVDEEACPLGLAPTASSTVMLSLGDALAISVFSLKGFTQEDFLHSHPGGNLGKKRFVKIKDVMRTSALIPSIEPNATIMDSLRKISDQNVGFVVVLEGKKPLGIFTDGDLRRVLINGTPLDSKIHNVMSQNPRRINSNALAIEAARMMEDFKISSLIVCDDNNDLEGVLNFQDLFRNKII
ncbi:MAG: KpsF/GutQ family sugar-phosphate isomerase [Nitrosomonadales bacterium]